MAYRILVIDDSLYMRSIIKDMLQNNGYEVVGEGVDGDDAVDLYRSLNPDLVTMDLTMPGIGGLEAIKEIIKINPEAKIVVVSAMGNQAMVLDALKAGAKDFMVKPFDIPRVIEVIERTMKL